MRVLQANKFFYPRGGAERYFLDLVELLPQAGHETAPFSMHHTKNLPSPWESHFVQYVDYTTQAGAFGTVAMAARTLYNRETRRRARDMVRAFRPQVAHLHNIHHQISGSLIETLREEGVPVVQTLHDYQWVCPVYRFLKRGAVCEDCRGDRYWKAISGRCQDGSVTRSMLAAAELALGRMRGWRDSVDLFLAPSHFLGEKMIEHGLPAEKVRQQNYCLPLDRYQPVYEPGKAALYAGRLSHEKGLGTLLQAMQQTPDLPLRIAGTGPREPELRRMADTFAPGRVTFLGHLGPTELIEEIAAARFVVVPSEWYENQPFAVLESFAVGTPVVGARIGGIPELVIDHETGILFEPGSPESLGQALRFLHETADLAQMGRRARERVEQDFDPHRHLDALTALYREVQK